MKSMICLAVALVVLFAGVRLRIEPTELKERKSRPMSEKIVKTDAEWKEALTPEQYQVTRQKGTECAFTGAYWDTKDEGMFVCVCCGQPLFHTSTKFNSGTGWPSFFKPLSPDAVETEEDRTHGMRRTEVMCKKCGAHLGHVFEDGPKPTGQRYCVNSISLKFEKKEK